MASDSPRGAWGSEARRSASRSDARNVCPRAAAGRVFDLAPDILLPGSALESFACPVVCVTGTHDDLVPPPVMHRFAELIPGARCVEFPESGHSPYFEEPEAFNAMLEEIFRKG